jgi:hypothetical protein
MSQDWSGLQTGTVKPEVQKEITQLGLSYRLMTPFTSFVAVEERVVTTNGKPQRVEVPVEMPDGMSYEGVFGGDGDEKDAFLYSPNAGLTLYARMGTASGSGGRAMRKMTRSNTTGTANGVGSGSGGGIGGGAGGGVYLAAAPPPPPPHSIARTVAEVAQPSPTSDPTTISERALLESKLSPAVLTLFDCWKNQSATCHLAPDGTAEVQLFLTEDPSTATEKLKALGLQVSQVRHREKLVIARLPLDKLPELAKLETVKFVTPVRR